MKCTLTLPPSRTYWTAFSVNTTTEFVHWTNEMNWMAQCTIMFSEMLIPFPSTCRFSLFFIFPFIRFVYATMNLSIWAWVQFVCEAANWRKTFPIPSAKCDIKAYFPHYTLHNPKCTHAFFIWLSSSSPVLWKHNFIYFCTSSIKIYRK